jgi:hypothetical protein
MTFSEAMTAARKEADHATAEAQRQKMAFPDAYTVGYLTASLARAMCDAHDAKVELQRHQSFIRTQ